MDDDFSYMIAIEEHGSISKAALAAHISQPGLSQKLKRIESLIGAPLFDRTTSPLRPTEAGRVYLDYARRALASEKQMQAEVRAVALNKKRRLRVGISLPRAVTLMPDIIQNFYLRRPGCSVDLVTLGSPEAVQDAFLQDAIDLALFTPVRIDPVLFKSEPLCQERLTLVAPTSFTLPTAKDLQGLGKIKFSELENVPLIMSTYGEYLDNLLIKVADMHNIRLNIIVRGCGDSLAYNLVEAGCGVTILPSTFLQTNRAVQRFAIDELDQLVELYAIRPICRSESDDARTLREITQEWLNNHPELQIA